MKTFLFALILLAAPAAHGEIYKYTDNKGELHFVDDMEKVPARYRKQVKEAKDLRSVSIVESGPVRASGVTRKTAVSATEPAAQPQFSGTVDLYVTSWCGYCRKMEQFLSLKAIPYRKLDIETDSSAAEAHAKLGGGGIPVARIGENIVRGYNPDAVLKYIGKK